MYKISTKCKNCPCDIDQFHYVQKIKIHRGLSSLPKELFNLNLIALDVSYNNITILPREIRNLKNLYSLKILNNNLRFLPKEIVSLSSLNHVLLNGNEYINTYGSIKERLDQLNEEGYIN